MEAQASVFENKGPRILKPVPEDEREELTGVQGPGGDSRPDRIDPADSHFVDVSEHPMVTTDRDPRDQPEARKPDPQFLEEHRVDQEDEIGARYDKATDGEKTTLGPRVTKKGDESEEL
jgi:hypothetical protein